MRDYLTELKNICKSCNSCEDCPFGRDISNFGLECDSGYYNKEDWDIDHIKKIIDDHLDKEEE